MTMTALISVYKKADILFQKKTVATILDKVLDLDVEDFVDLGDYDEFHELTLFLLEDKYYEYTKEIIERIFEKFPNLKKSYSSFLSENNRIFRITGIIDNEMHRNEKKDAWKIIIEVSKRYFKKFINIEIPKNNLYLNAEKTILKYLGIAPDLVRMLTIFNILNVKDDLYELIRDLNLLNTDRAEDLAYCFGMDGRVYKKITEELFSLGLLCRGRGYRNADKINAIYDPYENTDPSTWYDEELSGDELLSLDDFQIPSQYLSFLKIMLSNCKDKLVNILFYGEPGTGKTSLVKSLCSELGIKVFSVKSDLKDKDEDRRVSLCACINTARNFKGKSIVLIDEAERMLDTSMDNSQSKDKAWLNNLLEQKKISAIWITNQIEHVEASVKRRFDFSLYFPKLDKKQQKCIWRNVLTKYQLQDKFSSSAISVLNSDFEVPAAVIDRSVDYAKCYCSNDREFYSMLRTQLEMYTSLKEDGLSAAELQQIKKQKKKISGTLNNQYLPEAVNFNCDINKFIDGFNELDKYIKNTKSPKKGCGTILFYGPPGTGKTELGNYLAKITKRKAVIKRASDLLDCWVGNTEKNIAQTFRDLNIKKELLIIDEIDSFLFDRSNAIRSWENTQVNEFLTQLQEFRGILICTTNHIDGLDPATLRRFSSKLEFMYSKGSLLDVLFNSILKPLTNSELNQKEKEMLHQLTMLTPGDFHAVEASYSSLFSKGETLDNQKMLKALKHEMELKKGISNKRRIGFI